MGVSLSTLAYLVLGSILLVALHACFTILSLQSPLSKCRAWQIPTCRSRRSAVVDPQKRTRSLSLTIFTPPVRPYSNSSDDHQYQALLSWLSLQPIPKIVLVGDDPSFYRVSKRHYSHVHVEPNVDYNLWGTPQVHTIFARAQQESTDFSMVIDPTTFLFQDVMEALHRVHHRHERWVLFGRSWDVTAGSFDISFANGGSPGLINSNITSSRISKPCGNTRDLILSRGYLNDDVSYWAWNNLNMKRRSAGDLFCKQIPPLSYVRGTYDNCLLYHFLVESQSNRVFIDGSKSIVSVRIKSEKMTASEVEAKVNAVLSDRMDSCPRSLTRSSKHMIQNPSFKQLFLGASTPVDRGHCRQKQEYTAPKLGGGSVYDVVAKKNGFHTLDTVLPLVADEGKFVVMVGAISNYKEMLMSFVCRAKSLGIHNVLVAAFDEHLFEYAYLQGLPVYWEPASHEYNSYIGSDGQCRFASECFKRVSKLKSMSVLKVLRKGFSVLWSDVDIVWFANPLQHLLSFGYGTIVIQSDERNQKLPENNSANSGFYLARSDNRTIRAFEAIVAHAMKSDKTEQPSFDAILCGEKGEKRVGRRMCSQ
ncbi:hypothetical protein KP509_17G049000 [Ceratopteris richardii]|uniref:Nucleotide-diphospho-sugar transferase domain-containing protein n=1 Tax=Ceratopteris richardii TaxID=49495 RepID=A0A8T2SY14_CERRI|nr:hypothetical protein KP509_17G049000 [Ceratopteris richardii]